MYTMYHPHSEQDWTPVIFKKPQPPPKKPSNPIKNIEKDLYTDPTQEAPKQKPLPRLSHDEKQKMIQARTDKKLTQAQLAQQINEPVSVIQNIEAGKVIENKLVLGKIGRLLGVKLVCQ
jgi:putative transcription factor